MRRQPWQLQRCTNSRICKTCLIIFNNLNQIPYAVAKSVHRSFEQQCLMRFMLKKKQMANHNSLTKDKIQLWNPDSFFTLEIYLYVIIDVEQILRAIISATENHVFQMILSLCPHKLQSHLQHRNRHKTTVKPVFPPPLSSGHLPLTATYISSDTCTLRKSRFQISSMFIQDSKIWQNIQSIHTIIKKQYHNTEGQEFSMIVTHSSLLM